MSAREEILGRVRTAIAGAQPRPVPREYRTTSDDGLETFLDRLHHYDATTHVVDEAELNRTLRTIIGARRVAVPAGFPDAWIEGLEVIRDDPPLDHNALDQADGVITICALAIAQTGTIVLDGGPGMGRRALTLLPDYHLCVVSENQIVASVPKAIRALPDPRRPLTFISGPSATVDIEMTRVKGVHGPRRLEVIVTAAARADQET